MIEGLTMNGRVWNRGVSMFGFGGLLMSAITFGYRTHMPLGGVIVTYLYCTVIIPTFNTTLHPTSRQKQDALPGNSKEQ